jgi:glycosyltransferase involved in cell wall biosynthesis
MIAQQIRHVLMTADTVGGVWTYALELARGFAEKEIHVSLAAMGSRLSRNQRQQAQMLSNLEIYESDYKLEWMQDPWDDVERAGEWLLGLERRLNPDIVHLNGYSHAALSWRSPALVVAHSCVLSWWLAVMGEECDGRWDLYRKSIARGLRSAKLIIAPSQSMLYSLYANYGPIPAGKTIHNGRSSSLFYPKTKKPFILSAGRLWDKSKNIHLLDRAASGVSWPILVAGETVEPGTQKAAEYSRIETLGMLSPDKLAEIYSRASIFAAPAKYEPFGLSILEAGLSGCALVLGDIPSLREIWSNCALFVDPNSATALERVLNEVIHSPWLRRILGTRARKRALQFSLQRMAKEYVEAYQNIMNNNPRGFLELAATE